MLPFGFSDTSALLLRRLLPLAKKTGAVLHLLHVMEPPPSGPSSKHRSSEAQHEDLAEATHHVLNQWRNSLVRGHAPVFSSVRSGDRVPEILRRATELKADLIVMTTQCRRVCESPRLPSTAEQLTNRAACPVLVLPGAKVHQSGPDYDGFPPSSWKRILLPIDFTRSAAAALKYAAALTIENRASLVLLNIMLEGSRNGCPGTRGEDDYRRLERHGERRLNEWVKGQMVLPLEFESVIWAGLPSLYAVPLEAKLSKVDLVVMPVRTGCGTQPLRAGSVRDHILRSASCPILSLRDAMPG